MSYKIQIRSEEDFKWLAKQLKTHYQKSLEQPTLYLEYGEKYRRLSEDFDAAEKLKDDWTTLEDFRKKDQVAKKAAATKKAAGIAKTSPCSEHPQNTAQRAPRTPCETCWAAYKKYAGVAKYKFARAKFDKKAGS